MLTIGDLKAKIAMLENERAGVLAQLNRCDGALQVVRYMLLEAEQAASDEARGREVNAELNGAA
jgi:hypothetical protein